MPILANQPTKKKQRADPKQKREKQNAAESCQLGRLECRRIVIPRKGKQNDSLSCKQNECFHFLLLLEK